MSTEERIEELSAEIAKVRSKIDAPDDSVWYKKPATLISIAALAFSLGTTGFSAYNSHQEDIRANRRDVRAILQRLSKLPIENYELLQKNKGTGQGEALSGMINQENLLLANQAAELIERYPKSFTSTEYYAVAFALGNSNMVSKVPTFFVRAMEAAAASMDYSAAARTYAGYLYSKGDYTEGKRLYNEALNVWNKFPERNTYVVNSTDLLTLLYWSQSEFAVGNKREAQERLMDARKKLAALSQGPQTEALKSQIDYTARFVDQ
jgi:tetratricopeptide (TPR) repeat protein